MPAREGLRIRHVLEVAMAFHNQRQIKVAVLLILAAAVVVCSLPTDSQAQAAANPLTFTFSGLVRGKVSSAGVREFLGIRYAAAPVGNLRWRPPVPHAPWFQTFNATQFANHCPQTASPFGIASAAEDCLFLNVFTPESNAGGGIGELRPVMVWIHGGALVDGESDDYDPTAFVKDGVIVVTINYRLGILGFLAHPAFAAEKTDPAGGLSVFSQLASPSAANLFQKAIIESGAYQLTTQTLATAEAAGTAFATAAGCSSQSAACLRALPVNTLLANQNPAGYTPNIDGEFLPLSLGAALASGQFHHVPIIQGSNHDEWRLFTALDFDLTIGPIGNNEAAYEAALASLVGPGAPIVAAEYPLASFPSADLAFATAGTDVVFACPAYGADLAMSQFVPLSTYEFNDENAPQDFLPPVTFPYGAAHASELQYLFNLPITVPRPPLNAQQLQLSSSMQQYWTNFAKSGTPNGSGLPTWRQFNALEGNSQSLLPPSPMQETTFAPNHKCAFWAALLAAQ